MEKFIQHLKSHRPTVITFSAALVLAEECGYPVPSVLDFWTALESAGYRYNGNSDSWELGESPGLQPVVSGLA